MKLVFYIFIFSQLLNYISVFADKFKTDSSGSNSINWEKVQENKSNKLKKIIWKSYNNDDSYFKNKNYKVPNLKINENREANKFDVQIIIVEVNHRCLLFVQIVSSLVPLYLLLNPRVRFVLPRLPTLISSPRRLSSASY